ncbi:pentapeptide repeat-containing protein [Crossiella sp. SN42]|uniref:pentapeptide repeat-containing protein n=1 Tax=Crossiella sp. SN42 TaxID=2944808 RepID=UPI00207C9578|nr:pentapeptide repeat-containing protein [Crossiella sp. SN42]MCO1575499.1 pentapeptide repeat-containing protein [Crossiella sp. SN42]
MPDDTTNTRPRFTPDWPTCTEDAGQCTGRRLEGFEQCLAHLTADDLDTALARFTPGADVDLRGTALTPGLLHRLLAGMSEGGGPAPSPPRLGHADFGHCFFSGDGPQHNDHATPSDHTATFKFSGARFGGDAWFGGAEFGGAAGFDGVTFGGEAGFGGAEFGGEARFDGAEFGRAAGFDGAEFGGEASFDGVTFGAAAWFDGAEFGGEARFGDAKFGGAAGFGDAKFGRAAGFGGADFGQAAWFGGVTFGGEAGFIDVTFGAASWFGSADFGQAAWFGGATFGGEAGFGDAKFGGDASFDGAEFGGEARFDGATFARDARFGGATFGGEAWFTDATFGSDARFGPLVANTLSVDGASFAKRVVVEAETNRLSAGHTRFEGGVELRVRYARIDARGAFFGAPSSLSGAPAPFEHASLAVAAEQEQISAWVAERDGTDPVSVSQPRGAGLEEWVPQLLSVQETDVSQLTLADVDLRWCRFAGAHQLDKLRLEGRSPFNEPPGGWQIGLAWPPVWRWTSRRVLAEEHPWRAGRRKSGGWTKNLPDSHGVVFDVAERPPVGPERLVVVYRSLRKALEDAKNEAGAGDFYYGEMEARRHAPSTGFLERVLLTVYWLVSGYGQRASRALAVLAATIGVLFILLTTYGLPQDTALQQVTGTIPAAVAERGQQITLEVKPAPATPPPPDQRWTRDRMDKAIRIALGSVVFRDADQRLTPAGVWTVMAGRAFGPLLLALAALAIRARVKR